MHSSSFWECRGVMRLPRPRRPCTRRCHPQALPRLRTRSCFVTARLSFGVGGGLSLCLESLSLERQNRIMARLEPHPISHAIRTIDLLGPPVRPSLQADRARWQRRAEDFPLVWIRVLAHREDADNIFTGKSASRDQAQMLTEGRSGPRVQRAKSGEISLSAEVTQIGQHRNRDGPTTARHRWMRVWVFQTLAGMFPSSAANARHQPK